MQYSNAPINLTRRQWLAATGGIVAGSQCFPAPFVQAAPARRRPRVAVVYTIFTYRSHGHVLLENFLKPYLFNGKLTDPGVDVVSFYADQRPAGDMTDAVSKEYKIPVFKTIREALSLGGKSLAVDAVLSIGEHGSYPVNELGQRMYPRKRFFDEIVAVMKDSNRFVPVFNDKHLSYRWDWCQEMYNTARELKIPFMAGSSVPLAQRRPAMEVPAGAEIKEAVSIHGGPLESYDFHGLEVLQSVVEARKGGETGVAKVELLKGDELLAAGRAGRWSIDLAQRAMKAELGVDWKPLESPRGERKVVPHGLLLTYRDGMKATVLKIGHNSTRWNFACRTADDKKYATAYNVGPWQNRNLFKALSHAIQDHFIHGRAPYPVERTLLVSGILEAAMRSNRANKPIDTPKLAMSYQPRDFRAMREMGATWKIITDDVPQLKGITPNSNLKIKQKVQPR